jgi:hypothetical protein
LERFEQALAATVLVMPHTVHVSVKTFSVDIIIALSSGVTAYSTPAQPTQPLDLAPRYMLVPRLAWRRPAFIATAPGLAACKARFCWLCLISQMVTTLWSVAPGHISTAIHLPPHARHKINQVIFNIIIALEICAGGDERLRLLQ